MGKISILAIGAHPDDIEFGCGGALAKFAAKGHRVYLLVMSRGGMGGSPQVRAKEQDRAKAILGARQVFWGGYRDTYLVADKKMIVKIEKVIAGIKPAFIFCHYPDDTHQDHRNLSQATVSATRYIKNVLFYEGPTTQNFSPQVFIDVSDTLEQKVAALKVHHSQVTKTNIENLTIVELAYSGANFRGIQGRVKYAEAFHSLRLFINI